MCSEAPGGLERVIRVGSQLRPQQITFVTRNIEEAVVLGHRVVLRSAHPGRIIGTIDVKRPFPRDVTSAEFNAYRRDATAIIKAQVGLALSA